MEQLQRTIEKISSWARGTDFADDINEKSLTENFCSPGSSTYKNLPAFGNSPLAGSTMHTRAASPGTFNTDLFCPEKSSIPGSDDGSSDSSFVADVKHLIEELNTSANAEAGGEAQKEYLQWLDEQHARNRDLFESRHLALQEEVRIATALQDTRDLQRKIKAKENRYDPDAVRPTVEQLEKELMQAEEWNKELEQIWHIKAKQ